MAKKVAVFYSLAKAKDFARKVKGTIKNVFTEGDKKREVEYETKFDINHKNKVQ